MSKKDNSLYKKDVNKKKDAFELLIKTYLENKNANETVKIDFGINPQSPTITKTEYNTIIMDLYNYGFSIDNKQGDQILYIYPENDEDKAIYVKIYGIHYIENYCSNDSFILLKRKGVAKTATEEIKPRHCPMNNLKIIEKETPKKNVNTQLLNEYMNSIENKCVIPFLDFNFQITYKEEKELDIQDIKVENKIINWKTVKKYFKFINRVRLSHKEFPVFIDMLIIKTSPISKSGKPILSTTFLDSGVLQTNESYSVQIKINKKEIFDKTPQFVLATLRKTIRFILCTLQNTNYPISYDEHVNIQQKYLQLIMQKDFKQNISIQSNHFIGPSSFTLLIDNIIELDEMGEEVSGVPNIRKNYAVTDKADGLRNLLYITHEGNIYLIDFNMLFSFTGLKTLEKDKWNSIIDGEYIKIDKFGKSVSMFFAFDIYFINNADVRHYPFYDIQNHPIAISKKSSKISKSAAAAKTKASAAAAPERYTLLTQFITGLNAIPKEKSMTCQMKIHVKMFLFTDPSNPQSIFDKSKEMLAIMNDDNTYQYNKDGMIYTPMNLGVGQNKITDPILNYKVAWMRSLKWKPPQYNTIDFYVTIKKGDNNNDLITTEYTESGNIITYKTLILRCGYNEDYDGYINPFQDMIQGRNPTATPYYENNYKPYPFIPITPVDTNAQYVNIIIDDVVQTHTQTQTLKSEDGDSFEENTIVEFKYDLDKPPLWRWIPIRVRHDKTYKVRHGYKEYGNSFKTANSIWKSIHYPITEEMISTGGDTIPDVFDDGNDNYYNRKVITYDTKALRDFHNLYVKKGLILGVSNILPHKSTLIDFAVGKAGDLPKWIGGQFGFVFGIDIDTNNIKNRRDGACARYLNNKKEKVYNLPLAFFLVGDVTRPIKESATAAGSAFSEEIDKKISKVIFGDETVSMNDPQLGKGVLQLHKRGYNGFHLGSCQFAIHYFFETKEKIHGFLKNLAETITKDGYFIATSYDGNTVFSMLEEKRVDYQETYVIRKDNTKIFEITRMYKETGFPDDESSIGYAIDIFQESINNTIREYLVNAQYFIQLMEEYGFILCPEDELQRMRWNIHSATGLFSDLYSEMEKIEKNKPAFVKGQFKTAMSMSAEEKTISFLNRYYIFKKVREVSVDDIHKMHLHTVVKKTKKSPTKKSILHRIPNVQKYTIDPKKVDFIET